MQTPPVISGGAQFSGLQVFGNVYVRSIRRVRHLRLAFLHKPHDAGFEIGHLDLVETPLVFVMLRDLLVRRARDECLHGLASLLRRQGSQRLLQLVGMPRGDFGVMFFVTLDVTGK